MAKVLVAEVLEEAGLENELRRFREENPALVIQIVALPTVCPRAIEMIATQTLRALKTGAMVAEKPEVDLLLRVAGTNQITEAIQKAGFKVPGTKVLIAAGSAAAVGRLRRSLTAKEAAGYKILRSGTLDAGGSRMVEAGALLGAKR